MSGDNRRMRLSDLHFDSRFQRELPSDANSSRHSRQVHGALWSDVVPAPVGAPALVAYSREVADQIGVSEELLRSPDFVSVLAGNALFPGTRPFATNYGGHQFGNWAGQLGDGRAIALGEIVTPIGNRFELQLKGAGSTPYSRRADGRAVLRSSIREFLCSEAMHHLGVPTTRALSLVLTGDLVERDMFYDGNSEMEPGAIVCRVAPSFLRFGHFELPASRGESALLNTLIDFTIRNYFPELLSEHPNRGDRIIAWFSVVCARTATLVAHWMRVGFVHGVMNTDNLSVLGLTIDYGPYGWIDAVDHGWTPNTTDASGKRYCFGRQPGVAQWNLARLGDALATLPELSEDSLSSALSVFERTYREAITEAYGNKLGLNDWVDEQGDLLDDFFELCRAAEIDMTIFFRKLAVAEGANDFATAFYSADQFLQQQAVLIAWFARYQQRVNSEGNSDDHKAARRERMNRANPKFVLRNYLAQQAIDAAHDGDFTAIETLHDVMRRPYDEQPGRESFAEKRPEWARTKAGCSMLSCSS